MSGCWEDRMLQQITLYFLHPASNKLNWKPESNQGYQSSSTKWNHAFTWWQENTFKFGQISKWNKSLYFSIFTSIWKSCINIVKSDNHPIQYIWENQLFGTNLSFLYYTQPLIYFLKSSQTKGFTLTFSEYITFYWSIVWKILCKHWTSWETNPFSELLLYTTITANKITKRYYQQPVLFIAIYCLDKKNFLPINKRP